MGMKRTRDAIITLFMKPLVGYLAGYHKQLYPEHASINIGNE